LHGEHGFKAELKICGLSILDCHVCADLEQKTVRKGCMSVNTVVLPSIQLECVSLDTAWPQWKHRCWEHCV